jgi:hypothetical protein
MRRLSRKECLTRGLAAGLGGLAALATVGALPADAGASALAPASAAVGGVPAFWQTWNNCGPASVAAVLSYWGIERTQGAVAAVLRVDGSEHGMGPYGVPSYARSLGMQALVGVAGNTALLKALLATGFPVIVTQWVSMSDHTSHYRPLTAYDDNKAIFLASDPLLGPDHAIGYADFAPMWAEDDNRFLVLYPPSRRAVLAAVVAASGWTMARAYRYDLAWVQARLSSSASAVASWAPPVAVPGAPFLRLAWDEMQLGQATAARQALQHAAAEGAAPITVRWIAGEKG